MNVVTFGAEVHENGLSPLLLLRWLLEASGEVGRKTISSGLDAPESTDMITRSTTSSASSYAGNTTDATDAMDIVLTDTETTDAGKYRNFGYLRITADVEAVNMPAEHAVISAVVGAIRADAMPDARNSEYVSLIATIFEVNGKWQKRTLLTSADRSIAVVLFTRDQADGALTESTTHDQSGEIVHSGIRDYLAAVMRLGVCNARACNATDEQSGCVSEEAPSERLAWSAYSSIVEGTYISCDPKVDRDFPFTVDHFTVAEESEDDVDNCHRTLDDAKRYLAYLAVDMYRDSIGPTRAAELDKALAAQRTTRTAAS